MLRLPARSLVRVGSGLGRLDGDWAQLGLLCLFKSRFQVQTMAALIDATHQADRQTRPDPTRPKSRALPTDNNTSTTRIVALLHSLNNATSSPDNARDSPNLAK